MSLAETMARRFSAAGTAAHLHKAKGSDPVRVHLPLHLRRPSLAVVPSEVQGVPEERLPAHSVPEVSRAVRGDRGDRQGACRRSPDARRRARAFRDEGAIPRGRRQCCCCGRPMRRQFHGCNSRVQSNLACPGAASCREAST